jgi:hypothetical protein
MEDADMCDAAAAPDSADPLAIVSRYRGSSDALIRHTAFAPTEPDGGGGCDRTAATECA